MKYMGEQIKKEIEVASILNNPIFDSSFYKNIMILSLVGIIISITIGFMYNLWIILPLFVFFFFFSVLKIQKC